MSGTSKMDREGRIGLAQALRAQEYREPYPRSDVHVPPAARRRGLGGGVRSRRGCRRCSRSKGRRRGQPSKASASGWHPPLWAGRWAVCTRARRAAQAYAARRLDPWKWMEWMSTRHSYSSTHALIRGPAGSLVRLALLRGNNGSKSPFSAEPRPIPWTGRATRPPLRRPRGPAVPCGVVWRRPGRWPCLSNYTVRSAFAYSAPRPRQHGRSPKVPVVSYGAGPALMTYQTARWRTHGAAPARIGSAKVALRARFSRMRSRPKSCSAARALWERQRSARLSMRRWPATSMRMLVMELQSGLLPAALAAGVDIRAARFVPLPDAAADFGGNVPTLVRIAAACWRGVSRCALRRGVPRTCRRLRRRRPSRRGLRLRLRRSAVRWLRSFRTRTLAGRILALAEFVHQ